LIYDHRFQKEIVLLAPSEKTWGLSLNLARDRVDFFQI